MSEGAAMPPPRGSKAEEQTMREAYGTHRLRMFEAFRRNNYFVDGRMIAEIKAANPKWRDHKAFAEYVRGVENSTIRRERGRPRRTEIDNFNINLAIREYSIRRLLLRRLQQRGQLLKWLRRQCVVAQPGESVSRLAARLTLDKRPVNICVESLFNLASQRRRELGTTFSRTVDEIEGLYTSSKCTWRGTPNCFL